MAICLNLTEIGFSGVMVKVSVITAVIISSSSPNTGRNIASGTGTIPLMMFRKPK